MNNRYHELDSLRGIAAMLVFLFHMLMVLPTTLKEGVLWKLINLGPLHFLLKGDKQVIFFFILSGFVLSLPFFGEKKISYTSFIIRRILRLYIPYGVAITFSILLCIIFSKGGIVSLGELFNKVWVSPTNLKLLINHIMFIGNYDVYAYNVVIWSLIHELRISFIFPLLIVLAIRYNWKVNVALGLGLATFGAGIHFIIQDPFQPFYKTLFYIVMFIIGILISKYKDSLIDFYGSLAGNHKIVLLASGFLIYNYSDFIGNPLLVDWFTTLGISILFVILLASSSSSSSSRILMWSPFSYLGKISYGVYLYHFPILLTLIYLLYGIFPLFIIMCLSVILTLIISSITWHLIERPSIIFAKFISENTRFNIKRTIIVKGKSSN
jgi:peptidoglycan/LPS O-acetylase OafA/YrhL